MRHNRLTRGNAIAADPKEITPDEYRERIEANIRRMRDLHLQRRHIRTGETLPASLIEDMTAEDAEPVAPLPRIEVQPPRPVKPLPNQRDLFSHPDILPSEPEALLGLMHPA